MDQLALKERIIIMKEKSANYDKLLFNFKLVEEKYNNLLKKYNTLQSNMENNTVAGELAIMTHNNYLLKKELDEIQSSNNTKKNLLNNNLQDKNMNIFTNLHNSNNYSNNQHTDEINKLKTNYNNRINIFENVIEKHKKKNNILLDNLEKNLDIIRELKQQNEIYKNEIENKANYISSLIGEIDDFKGNLGDQKNNIKDLNTDINNLELDIEKKEIIIGELNSDKKDLKEINSRLIENKCDLFETINHRNGLIVILREENNELLNKNKKLKEETDELQSFNINFMEQLIKKETLISRLEKENSKIIDENNYKNNLLNENNELYLYINSLNIKIQKINEFNQIYLNELEETKKIIEIQKKEIETIEQLKLENQRLNNEIQQNNILSTINPLDWQNININANGNEIDITETDIDNNIDFINSIIIDNDNYNNLNDNKQTNDWTFVN